MKLAADRTSIVLIGSWNRAIFTPPWVGKLLEAESVEIGFAFGPNASTFFQRADKKSSTIEVGHDRLTFKVRGPSVDDIRATEDLACRVMDELPRTPCTAVGMNICFDVSEPSERLTAIFRSAEAESVAPVHGVLRSTVIHREFEISGGILNIYARKPVAPPLRLDFNHHMPVTDAETALKRVRGKFVEALADSQRCAAELFGLRKEG